MSDKSQVIVEFSTPPRGQPPHNQHWRIVLPDALDTIVDWYHVALNHVGSTRLHDTLRMHYAHPQLRRACRARVQTCDACQKHKTGGPGYGELPEREAQVAPWHEVAVDLIGPWKTTVHGQELTFHALTIIDTVTNYVEIVRLHSKQAQHVGQQFENAWLARYPRPVRVIFDQGMEFTGRGFQRVLRRYGLKAVPTSVKNPQANAICERMHLTAANALRVLLNDTPPADAAAASLLMDTALQTAAYGIRAAIHGTLRTTPGALVFNRDMLLDIPVISDLETIRLNRQAAINHQLLQANARRISHDYAVGEQVLKLRFKPDKLQPRAEGPYAITRVHTNGTVTIRRTPHITERLNIRRIKPYRT